MGETSPLFVIRVLIYYPAASIALQPSQPLPRILYLSNAWVSVLPEVEEFFWILGYNIS
jgi:hypothetical protein